MKDSYLHKKIMEEIDEYTVRCENIEALTEIYTERGNINEYSIC